MRRTDEVLAISVARSIASARTRADVEKALSVLERNYTTSWLPIGGDEANAGLIEAGSQPELQLIERITNAQDAVLELEAESRGDFPTSPAKAARQWFWTSDDGLVGMDERARRTLAERTVRVTVEESGDPKSPTITIQDWGIGQHPDDFPNTFVSIHRGNKLKKRYLIGVYGQGGATTFAHSESTIILSRRAAPLLSGHADEAGITVVRYNPLSAAYKKGRYEYLAAGNGKVFRVAGSQAGQLDLSSHGTIVTHVQYEMPDHHQAYRLTRTGVWALLNASLFETVLPIHVRGRRLIDTAAEPPAATTGRIVIGSASNLSGLPDASGKSGRKGGTYLDGSEEFSLSLGPHGQVEGRVWVLGGVDNTDAFVPSDQAVSYTLAGQTQGRLPQRFLATAGFGFLSKRMVVQIRFDNATDEAKRLLFPAMRERQRFGNLNRLLEERLSTWLADNPTLQALEEKAREDALSKASTSASDRLRKKVAERVARALAGKGFTFTGTAGRFAGAEAGAIKKRGATKKTRPLSPPDDSHLPAVPTHVKVANSPLVIPAGSSKSLLLEIDAKNGYVNAAGENLIVNIREGDRDISVHGRGTLSGGSTRVLIGAAADAKPRKHKVEIVVKKDGGDLTASAVIEIVERRAQKRRTRAQSGLPDILYVKKPQWPQNWDELEVGEVTESQHNITIRVNEDFDPLAHEIVARASASKASDPERRVERLKNSYLVPIATGLWLQHADKKLANGGLPSEDWLKSERRRLAVATLDSIQEVEAPTM